MLKVFFVLLFELTTIIIFSAILVSYLMRWDTQNKHSRFELFLLCLGLGPGVVSLIIYYLFLFIPQAGSLFYFVTVFVFFLCLAALNWRYLLKLNVNFYEGLDLNSQIDFSNIPPFPGIKRVTSIFNGAKIKFWIFLGLAGVFIYYWFKKVLNDPITGHDILEYAFQGKIFGDGMFIQYVKYRFDPDSNFFYVGLHGFSFPLLHAWERVVGNVLGVSSDLYFRSITGLYGFFILLVLFYFLNKRSFLLACFCIVLVYGTNGFRLTLTEYHIDTYRIYFLIGSFVFLGYFLKHQDMVSLVGFSLFAGLHSFSHSLGVFVSVFAFFSLFVFVKANLKERLRFALISIFIILLTGGIHYLLDSIIGTGWIFQELKYY